MPSVESASGALPETIGIPYSAFGLSLRSELELPWLCPGDGTPASARIILARDGEGWVERAQPTPGHPAVDVAPDDIRLSFAGLGAYRIRAGREIVVAPRPDCDPGRLRAGLLGPAMSMLLLQRGLLPMHASTVRIGGRVLAICAPSGGGKSTLVARLVERGHGFLADDLTPVDPRRDEPTCFSGFPRIKLSESVLAFLGQDIAALPRACGEQDERWLDARDAFVPGMLPLAAVVVLADGERLQVDRLSSLDGFAEILRQEKWPLLLDAAIGARELMERCSRVAARVPVLRLSRPRRLDELDALADTIEGVAASLT